MTSASSLLSDEDHAAVAKAIAKAEGQTRAQIVPVVATASGRYDRAESIFGLLFALVLLTLAWFWWPTDVARAWTNVGTSSPGLLATIAILLVGFASGTGLSSRFPVLRTMFVTTDEMREEVERAAHAAFYSEQIRGTRSATGVLIYVSLYERMVRVVVDDGVSEAVPQNKWDATCQLVVGAMQREEPAAGLTAAITLAGTVLSEVLPRDGETSNELADQLVLLD